MCIDYIQHETLSLMLSNALICWFQEKKLVYWLNIIATEEATI